MNNKVRSLIKMYKYLHYRNTVSVVLYISMILIGLGIGILSLFMYSQNLLVVGIVCIFAIENILFTTDYAMYFLDRNEEIDYMSFIPVSEQDYAKSRIFYASYIIGKILIITFITVNLVIRDYAINNIFLMGSALNIIAVAVSLYREMKYQADIIDRNSINRQSTLMTFFFLIVGFLLPQFIIKYKNTALIRFTSLNYINLSGGISSVAVVMLIVSVLVYIVLMKMLILRKDSE